MTGVQTCALPISSIVEVLRQYRSQRNSTIEVTDETPFFVGSRGRLLGHGLSLPQVNRVFIGLRDHLGWINRGAHNGPRIHDLRHTFVVRRVMLWHAQGVAGSRYFCESFYGHPCPTSGKNYATANAFGGPSRPASLVAYPARGMQHSCAMTRRDFVKPAFSLRYAP